MERLLADLIAEWRKAVRDRRAAAPGTEEQEAAALEVAEQIRDLHQRLSRLEDATPEELHANADMILEAEALLRRIKGEA